MLRQIFVPVRPWTMIKWNTLLQFSVKHAHKKDHLNKSIYLHLKRQLRGWRRLPPESTLFKLLSLLIDKADKSLFYQHETTLYTVLASEIFCPCVSIKNSSLKSGQTHFINIYLNKLIKQLRLSKAENDWERRWCENVFIPKTWISKNYSKNSLSKLQESKNYYRWKSLWQNQL